MKQKIYLAGAIRDDVEYDTRWREQAHRYLGEQFHLLDPTFGKHWDPKHGWIMHNVKATGDIFVHRDLAMIHQADFMLANLLPLDTDYKSIGTLMELGIAMERRLLTVVVANPVFLNHPFIASMAYRRASTLEAAIEWLKAEWAWVPE